MEPSHTLRVAAGLVCSLLAGSPAWAQSTASVATPATMPPTSSIPRSVPFNGQALTAKGEPRTGSVLATFSLYRDQKDDAPLWTEQQLVTLDPDGRYSVVLGTASPDGMPAQAFADGAPRWLGVRIEGDAEQPRFMLLSVPYALKAGDADTVGGKPVSQLVLSEKLTESVKSTLKAEGFAPRPSLPDVTVNQIPLFTTSGGSVGDSIMNQNAGRIGINNPTNLWQPYQTLRLDNAANQGSSFTLAATAAGGHYYSFLSTGPAATTGAGYFAIYDEGFGAYRMTIRPDGRVGIGTLAPPRMLSVDGGASFSAVVGNTNTGGEAVRGNCNTGGNACYAVEGVAQPSNYAGYFWGGHGVYAESDDNSAAGLYGIGYGTGSPGGEFYSPNYNSLIVDAPASDNGRAQLWVHGVNNSLFAGFISGAFFIDGNLTVGGSKSGYVVDIMQNAGDAPLEAGDVVEIVGNGPPVLGEIPVVTVRKASKAYATGVAGVVDQMWYVPDATVKTRYEAEQNALAAARIARASNRAVGDGQGKRLEPALPTSTISDTEGRLHAAPDETSAATGDYCSVVTLGSYRIVKADATFGAIHAGDLLTTSVNPGYAMKASDKVAAMGAIIGKALGDLESGTGTIPVLVTLK